MLDAVRNLCNQRFPAPSLDMLAMQEQSSGVEASMKTMLFAANASTSSSNRQLSAERAHTRPHPSQVLKCPRCDSLNTKFCYYNNYNLSQPRHFCKTCRRYWTKGGVLRNVPVGGGCRKSNHNNKKSKPRNITTTTTTPTSAHPRLPKSASNSTVTVSSSESSPITTTNETTSSSNSSVNVSNTDRTGRSHVFGSELHEILTQTEAGTFATGTVPPEVPVPRLFSGLDYVSQLYPPSFPAGRNVSENHSLFSSLLEGSNFVGTTFSDFQCKLQQPKTGAGFLGDEKTPTRLNGEKVQEPPFSADLLCTYTTNNTVFSHDNINNISPLEWQVNENSQILLEEPFCWGAESHVNWLDQTQFTYPNQGF